MARTNALALEAWLTTAVCALCACSTSTTFGRKINTAHVSDIRPCVTTEENLVAWFGEPTREGNENGLPTLQWSYVHVKATLGTPQAESESQLLVVFLNRAGKVVHFRLNPACAAMATEVKDVCAGADAGLVPGGRATTGSGSED